MTFMRMVTDLVHDDPESVPVVALVEAQEPGVEGSGRQQMQLGGMGMGMVIVMAMVKLRVVLAWC